LLVRAGARRVPSLLDILGIPIFRDGSIAEPEKRRRGRPATGKDPVASVRIPKELEAAIATWIERQPEPRPTRSEAIRRLIEKGLRIES
jgi:hypothetical protein